MSHDRVPILIEAACASVADCVEAEAAGADRLELCSALVVGGLTPSIGVFEAARARTTRPIVCMVRPRAGAFHYDPAELDAMRRDIDAFRAAGAQGVVFGVLSETGAVDVARLGELVERAGPLETVFHRALDVVRDADEALDALMAAGVTRVLTSGQARTALEGAPCIRRLVARAAGRIEILPGGGIRAGNLVRVLEATGVMAVHLGPQSQGADPSGQANPALSFAEPGSPPDQYARLDADALRAARAVAAEWDRG